MGEVNYKDINLKCGLEIHRQINSNKLFCNCPSELNDNKPDIIVKRYLRAVESELGKKDIVAEFELSKKKQGVYEAYFNTTCLVELDEQPPYSINEEALKTALKTALMLKASIIDQIQIMRKQVLDFSNTSGFQRTALIALNGFMENSKIGIESITLEEDSARKINETKDAVTYRLDRLGIPLIEIATKPDIKTPQQAKEVASYLGMLLKSTGNFKSGIGTIRQDINLSILNNPKVEIKGIKDLHSIPLVIENEVKRQLSLIKNNKKITADVRKANPDNTTSYLRPIGSSSRMYPETDVPPITITKKMLSEIKLPRLLTEKIKELEKKYKIHHNVAYEVLEIENFEDYIKKYKNIEPKFLAHILIEMPKEINTRFKIKPNYTNEHLETILRALNNNLMPKSAVLELLLEVSKGHNLDIDAYKKITEKDLENEIKSIIKGKKDLNFNALMGVIMNKYKGRVEGKLIAELLKKHFKPS